MTLYSQPSCGPCTGIKSQLKKNGIPFVELNVQEDDEANKELLDYYASQGEQPRTPLLKHGGTYLRHMTDMLAFAREHSQTR